MVLWYGAMTGGGREKCYSNNLHGIRNSMNNFKRLNREFGRGFRCKRFGGIRFYNDEEIKLNEISFLKNKAIRLKNLIDEMEKKSFR